MSKKILMPFKIAALQRVIAEPITDSAEQAALDKARRRPKHKAPKKSNQHGTKMPARSAAKKVDSRP
jgi:hypothetical protein